MTASTKNLDEILYSLGGCGNFQIAISVCIHVIKALVSWSFSTLVVSSKQPKLWWCVEDAGILNKTLCLESNLSSTCLENTCFTNGTACSRFKYGDSVETIVTEWDLNCDLSFVPSTIATIQVGGMLIGNFLGGQLADMFGRRPIIIIGCFLITAFNFIGYFSQSWILFAVTRLIIGIGSGFFLSNQYNYMCEFSTGRWRAWTVSVPSWSIEVCLFALFAWLLKDWRSIQLMVSIFGIPCIVMTWFLPESLRWYVAHNRHEDARNLAERIASVNKIHLEEVPEMPQYEPDEKNYTAIDLFRSWRLAKLTLLSASVWMSLGLVAYGIGFGIQALSGNLYINLFLYNVIQIPTRASTAWLQNKFGRKKTSIGCFAIVVVSGFIVGIVQSADAPHKDKLTNGFALVAGFGIEMAWGSVQTITIESFPTVVRTIGFGTVSVIARVGAMIGPQLVYFDKYVPGILYYVSAAMSALSIVCLAWIEETANTPMSDRIEINVKNIKDSRKKNVTV
ncbi:organic cation/carnitine transporter 2-like [Mya arenaria]|uniref:organic cation/carnitine transporter 2-like n=1 Tax=Mya arenaria TaxID=6604 RepID=UPI0022E5BE65|nr:organic cation/carnitine transporter 2-like [Mya arenaria]